MFESRRATMICVIGSLFAILPLLIGTADAQQIDTEQSVTAAATRGYEDWLAKIPAGQEQQYGFEDRTEFARATLGRPIPMLTIDPDTVDVGGEIRDIRTYRVPVLVDGTHRVLLTVALRDGVHRIVGLGAAELAEELDEYSRNGVGTDSDVRIYILRVFQLRSDFLVVAPRESGAEEGDFYPMRSARALLDLSADGSAEGRDAAAPRGQSRDKVSRGELMDILKRNFDRLPAEALSRSTR